MAKTKSIAALIAKVLSEELVEEIDGKLERVTLEEAIIRTTAKRALDPRNRLGMDATRFLTEYQYGKPVQPVGVDRRFDGGDEYGEYTEAELEEIQEGILKGAMGGHDQLTPKDPGRFIEEGRRDQIVQSVLESRGESIFERNKRAAEAYTEARAEVQAALVTPPIENFDGAEDLLNHRRELVDAPWT